MSKKVLTILTALFIGLSSMTGCETMGEATGEAVEEVKEGAGEFEQGYEKGKQPD